MNLRRNDRFDNGYIYGNNENGIYDWFALADELAITIYNIHRQRSSINTKQRWEGAESDQSFQI